MTPDSQILEQLPLADIHLPEAIGLWPIAWGWWVSILLLLCLLTCLVMAWKKHQKKWRYRKQALKLLKGSMQKYQASQEANEQSNQTVSQDLLSIVKRTAMTAYPEEAVEPLFGEQWIRFLNSKTKKNYFDGDSIDWIVKGRYSNQEYSIKLLHQHCKLWVKHHV